MEKRLIIAAAVSVLVLVAWDWMFRPAQPPPGATPPPGIERPVAEELGPDAPAPASEGGPREPAPADATPYDARPVEGAAVETVQVETDRFLVELTNAGGRVVSWRLREYMTRLGRPLPLFPDFVEEDAPLPLSVALDDQGLADRLNSAVYRVERRPAPRDGGLAEGEQIVFEWADADGREARKVLTFREGSYLVEVELEVRDRGIRKPARLALGPGFSAKPAEVGGWSSYYYQGQVLWNERGSVTRRKKDKLDGPGQVTGRLLWAGLEDQYFTSLVLPAPTAERSRATWRTHELTPVLPRGPEEAGGDNEAVEATAQPVVAVEIPETGARLYVGPKKYTLLREYGSELDEAVWFASNPALAWISRHIFLGLLWIHDNTIHNYGVAIILATVVLRLLLFPVNQYSMVSMKKAQLEMQRLQPKIKAIKNKYKKAKDAESRAKMNQEMMELYRKEGVNPMGGVSGCLPLLAQFPILIGFYNMLTVAIELRGAPFFGWIQDLSLADPLYITPLLMGATMFWQQKMAMSKIKDPVQQQQQKFMLIMPVVFTWICIQMPSGMVLYWFVNNLLGIGQQWLVNRHTSRLETAAQKV